MNYRGSLCRISSGVGRTPNFAMIEPRPAQRRRLFSARRADGGCLICTAQIFNSKYGRRCCAFRQAPLCLMAALPIHWINPVQRVPLAARCIGNLSTSNEIIGRDIARLRTFRADPEADRHSQHKLPAGRRERIALPLQAFHATFWRHTDGLTG